MGERMALTPILTVFASLQYLPKLALFVVTPMKSNPRRLTPDEFARKRFHKFSRRQ